MLDLKNDDLKSYKLPLQPAPASILNAVARGVQKVESFCSPEAAESFLGDIEPPQNGVYRDATGRVLVTCVTDMPNVTPAMIDWWFGWHLPLSERYRLWHPTAHLKATCKDDRQHLTNDREKYIGNVSCVDEYIGKKLMKLAITFAEPKSFNIGKLDKLNATAICAYTTDRIAKARAGRLVHYVIPTLTGSQMRSGFWLGEIEHNFALINTVMHGVLNTKTMRDLLISDRMALDLLQHCGEEMNHLARFLPTLYVNANHVNVNDVNANDVTRQ